MPLTMHLGRPRRGVWRLFDDYDWSLWQAGCLLLVGEKECSLVRRTGEELSGDACADVSLLPAGLPCNRLRQAACGITQRPLFGRGETHCSERDVSIVDSNGKAVAWGHYEQWRLPSRQLLAKGLWLCPLRGYEAECEELRTAFDRVAERSAEGSLLFPALEQGRVPRFRPDVPDLRMALSDSGPVGRAVGEHLASLLATSWRNEEGILADMDPECLHHYRVGLRRARVLVTHAEAVLGEQTAQRLAAHLRELGCRTGLLRDVDVQMQNRTWYESLLPAGERTAMEGFGVFLAERRKQARRSLKRYLRSATYAHARDEIEQLLAAIPDGDEAVGALLSGALQRRFRRFRKLSRKLGDESSDSELHRLRIEAKKLRYLFEFAEGIFGKSQVAKWLPVLRELQDSLGKAHDVAICAQWVAQYAREHDLQRSEAQTVASLAKALERLHSESRRAAICRVRSFMKRRGREFSALIHVGEKVP